MTRDEMEVRGQPLRLSDMESWRSPHGRPLPPIGQRTLLMGVLNVTPDSFSDGGRLSTVERVVERAGQMVAAGADILDIGGESTRPGATPVSELEEMARVLPAIAAVRRAYPDKPLSIDTFKAGVAENAIREGADIVNDIWGLTYGMPPDARESGLNSTGAGAPVPSPPPTLMAEAVARAGCPVILMHNRPDRLYRDFWADLLSDVKLSLAIARAAGVREGQIWLDPGFGFAKDVPHNLEIIKHLGRLIALGYPVLVGTSRKSTIGKVLGTDVHDRIEGTGATAVWAIQQGCHMIRTHDVREIGRFARMADAIKAGLGFQL